jgi:diamine N-acetyltransferase
MIKLLEVTQDNVDDVIKLSETLSEDHNKMVAPNVVSLAQAYANYDCTYVRAIYNGDVLVGFVMLDTDYEREKTGKNEGVYLWRLMIASDAQGKGYGKLAIDLLVKYFKEQNKKHFDVTSALGEGSPLEFYKNYGFVDTGALHQGEAILHLDL